MDISSELLPLSEPLEKARSDFADHTDVNELINSICGVLTALTEALVISIVQQLLDSQAFVARLKAIGATKALRLHGYRNLYVRLLIGERHLLRAPYFVRARPKKRRKCKKTKADGHLALAYLGFIDWIGLRLASAAAQAALFCPSFEIARQSLQHHGIHLGVKTLQRICRIIGEKAMAHRDAIALDKHERADGRVVLVCIDGGRLRERKPKRSRRHKGQKRQGYYTIVVSQSRSSYNTSMPMVVRPMTSCRYMMPPWVTLIRLLNSSKLTCAGWASVEPNR